MAGAEIFSLFGRIVADNSEALKKIDEAVDHAKKADEKLSKSFGQSLTNGLKTAGDNIAGFVGGVGNKIDDLGSNILSLGTHFNNMAGMASSSFISVGSGAETVGNKLTSFITKPALAAGTALAGITIGKGFQRLVGIDSAQAKLKGLGHDAKSIQTIMDDALASVKGTSFGLDEAVTTASTAVAAGIKPGKELERYLTLVGDASAIAGTNMTEMGSVFNKIATSGVIQAEELNQLGDRGIPIFQMLADELGVTAGEVKKLASDGEISSEIFLNAVESGFGGAAAIMGSESFSAAFDNFLASVGRIGANFLKGDGEANSFFETVKKGLSDALALLEPLEALGGKAGLVFGESFGKMGKQFSGFVDQFKDWDEETQLAFIKQKANFAGLALATGPALIGIGKILQMGGKFGSVFSKNGKAMSKFTKNLTKSDGALGKLSKSMSNVGKEGGALNKVMSGAGKSVTGFAKALGGALTLMSGVGSLGFLMLAIAGIVAGFGLIPEGMRNALKDTLSTVRKDGPKILKSLSDTIEKQLPEIMERGADLFTDLVTTITEIMPNLSEVGQTLLSGLLEGMRDNGQQVFNAVVGLITSIGQAFADNIGYIFSLGTLFIQQLGNAISENSGEIVNLAISLVEALALGLIEALPQIGETAVTIIDGIAQGILDNQERIKEAGANIINALKQSFEDNPEGWLAIGAVIVGKIALGIMTSATTSFAPVAIKMVAMGTMMVGKVALGIATSAGKLVLSGALIVSKFALGIVTSGAQLILAGVKLVGTLAAGVITAKGILIAGAIALIAGFIYAIVKHWDELKVIGSEILNKLWEGLQSIWGSVAEWYESSMAKFSEWADSIDLYDIGSNILTGLWNGLKSVWTNVSSWFSGKMEDLKEMAQNIMSIFSPSRFFDWLGRMMFKGLGDGMEKEAPKSDKIMADELEAMKRHAEQLAHLEAGSMDMPTISGANNDTSGYTLGQAEQVTQTNRLFLLLEEAVNYLETLVRKDDGVYMDSREVSKQIDQPLEEYRRVKETVNNRFKGAY